MWAGSDRAHIKWKFCRRTGDKTCTVRTTKKICICRNMNHEVYGKYHSGPQTKWNITEPQIPQVTVFSEYGGNSDHIPIKILKYQLKGEKSNERYYFIIPITGLGRHREERVIMTLVNYHFHRPYS